MTSAASGPASGTAADERIARCRCGQLSATIRGEPVRVSVCHCLDCQRRSGSAFAAQARFPAEAVSMTGAYRTWRRTGDEGSVMIDRWCPECGTSVGYTIEGQDDLIAIPIGTIDGPLPSPAYSVYEGRKRPWVAITGPVDHFD